MCDRHRNPTAGRRPNSTGVVTCAGTGTLVFCKHIQLLNPGGIGGIGGMGGIGGIGARDILR